jgi:SWI/SNF-related matrix-associated actin-dependent regulator of chromatin subfamily A-like protein 1
VKQIPDATAMLEGENIVLSFPYNLDTLDIVRDITGRAWDKGRKVWLIPATPWHAHEVQSRLSGLFYFDPAIARLAKGTRVRPTIKLPDGLYPFQQDGVRYIINTGGRCIVADAMGLGKTIEALAYVKMFGGKILIVSPANVLFKWRDEYRKWVGGSCEVILTGAEPLPEVDALIMSYAIMTGRYEELAQMPFDIGIWDEAHYLKNPKAQRTRVAKGIINAGLQRVLFLSGTPFMNEPTELFPLLNMIDPLGFRDYWQYVRKYCGAELIDGMLIVPKRTVTNVDELTKRLEKVMIRRTKQDVLSELPDLTRSYIPIEIDNMSAYVRACRDVSGWLREKGKEVKSISNVLTKLGILRQIIGEGKVAAAVELAENILESGQSVVLFAHHKDVVAKLMGRLKSYRPLVIDGSTPAAKRNENSKLFLMPQSPFRVMIMSVAGAEGIDMYSASDIIFVEREWTPAKEEQAESRLHRIGQKSNVTAHYIVAAGTYDEEMNKLVQEKRQVTGQVIKQDEIVELLVDYLSGGS